MGTDRTLPVPGALDVFNGVETFRAGWEALNGVDTFRTGGANVSGCVEGRVVAG